MEPMYYIGLDVHKRIISYCVKDASGKMHSEGSIPATRLDLDHWMKTLPQPRATAMEATMFTGWIYDHLKPHAAALKVAPRNSSELAMLYDREKQKGNANRATLAVERRLVAYLMAVHCRRREFQVVETSNGVAK